MLVAAPLSAAPAASLLVRTPAAPLLAAPAASLLAVSSRGKVCSNGMNSTRTAVSFDGQPPADLLGFFLKIPYAFKMFRYFHFKDATENSAEFEALGLLPHGKPSSRAGNGGFKVHTKCAPCLRQQNEA